MPHFAPGGCYHPPGLQIVSRMITSSTSRETHAMRLYESPHSDPPLGTEREQFPPLQGKIGEGSIY